MKRANRKQTAQKRSFAENIRRMFGKRFRAGAYSAFSAVIIIAIAIIVNMIAETLPANMTQIDLTADSLYSLSEQSKRITASIDSDVDLYLLATTGGEDETITRLLEQYAGQNDHISVSTVDPTLQPTFLDQYDLQMNQLYANSVLVDCNGRYRLVSYNDIYVTSYVQISSSYYGYTTTTEFDGENALTNAIHYVTSENLPKIYTLSGHGESELSDSITEMIAQDNMELDSLNLLTLDSVPEDASAIVIHVPSTDLSEEEADMLIEWLQNGGKIALITDYIEEGEMTNLLRVTEFMGMTVDYGLIVEGDASMHVSRYPYYLLPDMLDHEITSALIDNGYYMLLPLAQGILKTGEGDASVINLLSTSDSAYTKADGLNATTVEQEESDAVGKYYPGVIARMDETKMFWITSGSFLNASIDQAVSGANSNAFMNVLNWMCDHEESISIRSKSLDRTSLTVTSSESNFWSIIMIGMIPIAFIAVGIIVTIWRKRR